MAGIGDALGLVFAGAAGNYADNRSQQIGDEEKARIAQAREERLMAIRDRYDTAARKDTQAFQSSERQATQQYESTERQKDRDLTASEGAANRANAIAAASIRSAGSGSNDPSQRLQGNIREEKDEDGNPTGRYIKTYRDGSMEIVEASEIPGGDKPTAAQKRDREAEAATYAKKRVDEMATYLGSDKEDFKQFGGSRAKAEDHFKREYLAGKADASATDADDSSTTSDVDPSVPDRPAKLQAGADMAQAELAAKEGRPAARQGSESKPSASNARLTAQQAAIVARVRERNPGATDEQIIGALKRNPQTAPLFQ